MSQNGMNGNICKKNLFQGKKKPTVSDQYFPNKATPFLILDYWYKRNPCFSWFSDLPKNSHEKHGSQRYATPFEAPHLGNNGQLSRDERVQLYGIDCDDQVGFDGELMVIGYTWIYPPVNIENMWKIHENPLVVDDFHRETMCRSKQLTDVYIDDFYL